MRNIILSKSSRNPRTVLVALPLLFPGLCTSRAASLNHAIGRGIRRSKGVGFRGKEKTRVENWDHGTRDVAIRRSSETRADIYAKSPMTRRGWMGSSEKPSNMRGKSNTRSQTTQRGRFEEAIGQAIGHPTRNVEGPVRIRIGKRMIKDEQEKSRGRTSKFKNPANIFGKQSLAKRGTVIKEVHSQGYRSGKEGGKAFFERRDGRSDDSPASRQDSEFGQYRKGRDTGSPGQARPLYRTESTRATPSRPSWEHREKVNSFDSGTPDRPASSAAKYPSLAGGKSSDQSKLQERSTNFRNRDPPWAKDDDRPSDPLRFAKSVDKRMPISIPYTTPASEFLYGTSVVEAALKSRKIPRRKYYKLYIYTGENRESVQRDAELERLARRSGVQVARVGTDWLPLIDKMSGSRPHNGYILEASPLPRLPVTSLGELTEQDDKHGFKVVTGYQTREDAVVNGTSSFVMSAKNNSRRKPLVLFLDSILDPGNLGGIIRTASFLGVTAIAISKNCTAFSPIVLKASAGASENITLLTVDKPAGFIADSKLAGWKIFAGVAPSGSHMPSLISTDDLADPLSEDPCILMLGGEGEGLRMNLRSKADVQLSIRGGGQSHNVDSLNVSVATGILCNAFLRRSSASPLGQMPKVEENDMIPVRDLF